MNRWIVLLLGWVLTACSGGGSPTPVPDTQAIIIPDTTKVTDAATRSALTAYDHSSGVMRFSRQTPVLTALQSGDVLVSEPSNAAPNGYLRKVTAVRSEGGELVLETTQATFTDAVTQGVLDAHVDLTPAQVQRTEVLEGVSITPTPATLQPQEQVGVGENYAFSVTFNHVFAPQSGPNVSGRVTVDGSVSYNVGLGVYVAVNGPRLYPPRLISVGPVEAKVGFAQQASLHLTGEVVGDLGDEFKFATQYYEPLIFFIGPVPVVVVPRLDLYLSAGGRVEGRLDFRASESSVAQLGARWTTDDGWKNITGFDFSGDVPRPTVTGTVKPRAGIKSTFGFKLYDVAGPEMSLLGSLELDGQIPRNPNWIVNGSLKGSMNFKVELPILGTLADYQVTLFDKTLEFSRAGNTSPILALTDLARPTSSPIFGGPPAAILDLRAPVFMGNGCVSFGGFPVVAYFIASDLEDGCTLNVAVLSDIDGALPSTGKYAFGTEGMRRITVTVRDSQGTSASKAFYLYVMNTAPTLTVQSAGDPRQGEAYSVAAQVTDPNEPDPGTLCARTAWVVDAPDTLATTTGCLQTVTFGTTGARQVRATTTDSDGAATSMTLTLNVVPPPANPYPRITGASLNSRELKSSGGVDFCVTRPVANNPAAPIDLRDLGCKISPEPGQPAPQRYFAGVGVENPDDEALTYTWRLYGSVNGTEKLLQTGSQPQFDLLPNPGGNNASPGTANCRLTVTVSVADPGRSKSASVWMGRCTYFFTRIA